MVARQLGVAVGNERYLCRHHLKHEVDISVDRVSFDVEFRSDERFYLPHVLIADVSFVRSWMHGYALGAKQLAVNGGLFHVGIVAASGVAQGGYLVYVYT